ncbi:hypothetical protein F903_01718 [Acinetobacter sp. NIPH 298]|nr:hypothetical protein F903_01718 [Acinetobacter sp. NIPH 298]
MSWLFSQALVAEYSDRISWDCEQSAQLNVMPTQHKFWRNDKMMEFSRLSQFGLTLQLLTENHGQELLMLYLADFHAKTFHLQERVQGSMENVQDFGQKWHELSVKFDLEKCGWKTHQCLFPEDLPESSVTLPKWGMTRTGHVFQHLTLERPISVTESGLWATPVASDWKRNGYPGDLMRKSPTLGAMVHIYPTPKASDGNKRGKVSSHHQNGLAGAVKSGQDGGVLNPDWVEWLMGWPIGWTDLKPLEMDKFQSWLKAHLNF